MQAKLDPALPDMRAIYRAWHGALSSVYDPSPPDLLADAVLTWAHWLLKRGEGREASDAVDETRRALRETSAAARLEDRWQRLLDDMETAVEPVDLLVDAAVDTSDD